MFFNHLPVEVIHRIYDYCDTTTIFSARVTCKQLHSAANSYNQYELDYNYTTADKLSIVIRLIPLENFVSVILSRGYFEDTWISDLLSLIDIRKLNRLRSVALSGLNDDELERILERINSNFILSLAIDFDEKKCNKVFGIVSSAIARINIRKLHLNTIGYNNKKITWPTNCSLKYLIIDTCTDDQYQIIIHNLSYLENLFVGKFVDDYYENDENLLLSSSLKYLTIAEISLPMKDIQLLLLKTPGLINLKLTSVNRVFDTLFNGTSWEVFIRNALPSLIKFEFFFESCLSEKHYDHNGRCYYHKEDYIHTSLNSIILPFRTPFWLVEKCWFVTCDFTIKSGEIRIYTMPAIVIEDWSEYRCELLPSDSVPHFAKRSINKTINTTGDKKCMILNLKDCGINFTRVAHIADTLQHDTTITELNLETNSIELEGVKYITNALQHNKTLTRLNLGQNTFAGDGLKLIADTLKSNTTLKAIELPFCYLGRDGLDYFINALYTNTTLTELNLYANDVKVDLIKQLACLLCNKTTTLTILRLDDNRIDAVSAQHLADALKQNKASTLTFLSLNRNEIKEEGVKYLADALQTNATLRKLHLDWNTIGTAGVQYLSNVVRQNTTLTELSIVYNMIGNKGVESLCDALRHNKTLTSLSLINNQIEFVGAQHFAKILQNNSTITKIELGANLIGDKGAGYLADVFRINSTILEVDLRRNRIGNKGAEFIASSLRYNKTITEIDLSDNRIGDNGIDYIIDALQDNITLETIKINDNPCNFEKRKYLYDFLKGRSTSEDETDSSSESS